LIAFSTAASRAPAVQRRSHRSWAVQRRADGAAAATPLAKSSWIDARYAASIAAGTTPVVYVSLTGAQEVLAYATNTTPTVPPTQQAPVETITCPAEPAGTGLIGNVFNFNLALTGPNDRHLLVAPHDTARDLQVRLSQRNVGDDHFSPRANRC
jgi:hypothetical protein